MFVAKAAKKPNTPAARTAVRPRNTMRRCDSRRMTPCGCTRQPRRLTSRRCLRSRDRILPRAPVLPFPRRGPLRSRSCATRRWSYPPNPQPVASPAIVATRLSTRRTRCVLRRLLLVQKARTKTRTPTPPRKCCSGTHTARSPDDCAIGRADVVAHASKNCRQFARQARQSSRQLHVNLHVRAKWTSTLPSVRPFLASLF